MTKFLWFFALTFLSQSVDAQWNSIGDSISLSTFMIEGTYSPGVSAVDVDGDGWEDLTFGNDLHGIDLYLKSEVGFVETPVDLGLSPGDCTPKGVVWADMDNDADQDLFLTCRIGHNRIYRNLGGLVMQDITDSSGIVVDASRKGYGLSLADINLDGHLDLFIANYVSTLPLVPNEFYLGDGGGHYTLVEWGLPQDLTTPSHQGQFIDLNDDDRLDLYVINDKNDPNELYIGTDSGFVDMSAATGRSSTRTRSGISPVPLATSLCFPASTRHAETGHFKYDKWYGLSCRPYLTNGLKIWRENSMFFFDSARGKYMLNRL